MSGISGIYRSDGGIAASEVWEMVRTLAHRGPDAEAVWTADRVGLGHCTRRAVPRAGPPEDGMPLVDPRGPFVLVADASIDNRDALAARLGWSRPGAAVTDHALIMGAYLRWGERCARHLHGDFAFALWDGRRQCLFCARDHLGLRPFYYCRTGRSFAFASEIKALLRLARVPRRINEARVADFLLQATADCEATFYEGILRLPPAHFLVVSPEGMRMQRYWSLDPGREVRLGSDDAYADAFRERFTEAVRSCSRGGAPLGCLLSGGLDSSAITVVARAQAGGEAPLSTFSCVFDAVPQCDERAYAEAVVRQGGLQPHFVPADRTSIFDDLDEMLHHVEEPFFTPNLFVSWQAWRAAGAAGVRRLLHGFLGDNVVSDGSRYLTELALSLRWASLVREMRAVGRLRGHQARLYRHLLRQFVVAPALPSALRRSDVLMRRQFAAYPFYAFVGDDFGKRVGWADRVRAHAERSLAVPRSVRAGHYAELTSGLLPGVLEIENRATAAFGFEQRYPFADRRLVEFCLALPSTQKYRDGWTRFVERQAMRGLLPEEVRLRPAKTSLHAAFSRALMTLGRAELDAILNERLALASDYLDVGALQAAYAEAKQRLDLHGRPGRSVMPFWQAALLVRWLELQHDPPPPRFARPERELAPAAVPRPDAGG